MARKHNSENDLVVSAATPVRRKATGTRRVKHSAQPAEALQSTAAAAVNEPSNDAISRLAYSYWEARGFCGGSSEEDWLRAERELRASLSASRFVAAGK
jgi:hypothetical protein